MIWIAVGLLVFTASVVWLITAAERWGPDPEVAFTRFSQRWLFVILLGFLLPIWSLCFATQAIGGEREGRTLFWLLTRPLSRPAIYLAKFAGLLPWGLALNLGGFALICLTAGEMGVLALELYWPAILLATFAYCALFHLIGAWFRWPAVVALVYTFFIETFVLIIPGTMKRISFSFYARCLMLEAAENQGVRLVRDEDFQAVSASTAVWMLLGLTVLLLATGTYLFARREYVEEG
jgi:ABC-type transport system involved in multi-copper enzyme maturation permease subunit